MTKTMNRWMKAVLMMAVVLVMMMGMSAGASAATRKGYTLGSGWTRVYSSSTLRTGKGWIYGTDEVQVQTVTNSYCYVRYPVTNSKGWTTGYKYGYIRRSAILTSTGGTGYKATQKITTYRRASYSKTYGYIAKGDTVTVLGRTGSFTQVKYPVSGGYKYACIPTSQTKYLTKQSASTNSRESYATISNGTYRITPACAPNSCLDVKDYGKSNGTNILLWNYHKGTNQHFKAVRQNDGSYVFYDTNSGKVIDVCGGVAKNQINVQLYQYNGSAAQKFFLVSAGNGYYYLVSAINRNYCIDVNEMSCKNGANIQLYQRNGCNAQRFRFDSVSTTSQSTSSAKVSLNVTYYMQTDSRWSGTRIGTKTIGQIGCLTTAIAMKYSYHTKTSTNPAQMKNKLRYSNNDLYWSSVTNLGYTVSGEYNTKITNSMMSLIYSKLKAGRPVVIGGKSGSSQHWVIITGYTGTSTSSFSASNFKILDPANSNRTTLQAFLNYRPTVMRLVY